MIKKTFLILWLAFTCGLAFAQDLIVTKEAKKIEAKVTEINTTDIKYKLFNNLDGPTYTMQKSEISSIIYKNGTIDLFDNDKAAATVQPPVEKNETSLVRRDFPEMSDSQQLEYLKQFDTELYTTFKKGYDKSKGGKKDLIWGGVSTGVGIICLMIANNPVTYWCGWGELVIGQVLFIYGIVDTSTGSAMKKSVQNEYKEKYLTHANPKGQFQLQLSNNGLGLAYVF